ncbi:MAG: polyhydroxyalkanoic acid system family protein [Myxococcota bacterium]
MQFDYPYSMPDDQVRVRLGALGEYLQNRHGIKVTWTDDHAATFGGKYLVVKIDGTLSFGDGMIRFKGEDPGMLWRKKAVKYMRGKLEQYLDPSKRPEDLPRNKT